MKIDLQNRAPTVTRLHDFRQRVERKWDVLNFVPKTPQEILDTCWLPLGSVDDEYTDCYLVDQKVVGELGPYEDPQKEPPVLLRVYEQLDGLNETLVGSPDVIIGQDGLTIVTLHYLQLELGTAIYKIPGTAVCPAPHDNCVLRDEKRTDDGTLRTIDRTYISSGLISETDEIHNNGALLMKTLVYVNETAPTPSGYTLISTKTEYPGGLPVTTTVWAKGTGQVSYQTEYRLSPDQGTTGVTVTTIKYLTTPLVNANPITPPASSVEISVTYEESEGHRVWTAIYASGQGTIATDLSIENFGKLVLYNITSINAPPSAPAPTIGGTVTLIKSSQRNGTRFEDGTVMYDYDWAEGQGVIDQRIQTRDGGLRLETWVSLGVAYDPSFMLPLGILVMKDQELVRGTMRFTVSCMQNAAGTDPTVGTALQFNDKHPFRYPGRAKAYVKSFIAIAPDATSFTAHAYDVFLSPPVDLEVDATVDVTYATDSTLSLGTAFWNPDSWATVVAAWETYDIRPISVVQTHTGYRAVSPGLVLNFTAGTEISSGGTVILTGVNTSCMGQRVYGTSSGSIVVYGGPPAPDYRTWYLAARVELAFTGLDGTQYFRKTLVSATIPGQSALPV